MIDAFSSQVAFLNYCPNANGVKTTELKIIVNRKTDLNTTFCILLKLLILLWTFKSELKSEKLTSIQTVGEQAGSQMALTVSPI